MSVNLFAQQDYNTYYQEMNPADDSLPQESKLVVLQNFLDDAIQQRDTVRIIHGHLYVASLLKRSANFTETIDHLLEAERWAKLQGNQLLLGRIYHKKAVIYTFLENYDRAIDGFGLAIKYHRAVRDSQYLGITYEQLGAVYGYVDSLELANKYYELAIPIIRGHGSKNSLAVTFANYGNVLSYQDSTAAAVRSYQRALAINEELGDLYQSSPCITNIAGEYRTLGRYEEALQLYHKAVKIDRSNGWMHFLYLDYEGLAGVHEKLEQFDSAVYYHHLYEHLRDSISGAKVQVSISQQEAEFASVEQTHLLFAQKSLTRSIVMVAGLLLLVFSAGLLLLYLLNRKKNRQLAANRQELAALLKRLQAKNFSIQPIKQMTRETNTVSKDAPTPSVFDPYETKILRTDDWDNFKLQFEKSYPGFIHKLRTTYPDLTEAEERLFLLLKLNLSSREIANTLGIQPQSVKKTRTRLRKRLQLESSASLSGFVNGF